jgi:N-acetylglutamate synthase-like GNAT family acetyltransferase
MKSRIVSRFTRTGGERIMEPTKLDVTIEPATVEDGSAILRLLSVAGLPVDGLLDHLGTAVVARAGGRVVGAAALEVYVDGTLLRSVVVDADAKGLGIGTRVTNAALSLATALGTPAVYLLTTTAEGFFSKFALERIARDQVPAGVQMSVEFRSACPSTATVMRRAIR